MGCADPVLVADGPGATRGGGPGTRQWSNGAMIAPHDHRATVQAGEGGAVFTGLQRAVPGATPSWSMALEVGAISSACLLKENFSHNGRILHKPGQRGYSRTRIEPSRSRSWFCSVEDALQAGWRAALTRDIGTTSKTRQHFAAFAPRKAPRGRACLLFGHSPGPRERCNAAAASDPDQGKARAQLLG